MLNPTEPAAAARLRMQWTGQGLEGTWPWPGLQSSLRLVPLPCRAYQRPEPSSCVAAPSNWNVGVAVIRHCPSN